MAKYKIKSKKNRSHIPQRLNLLFFITFLAFTALFVRLGYLQLYQGETLTNMVQRTESTQSTGSVPRGVIYDSQGRILVGNQPELAILYTRDRASRVDALDIVNVAKELACIAKLKLKTGIKVSFFGNTFIIREGYFFIEMFCPPLHFLLKTFPLIRNYLGGYK